MPSRPLRFRRGVAPSRDTSSHAILRRLLTIFLISMLFHAGTTTAQEAPPTEPPAPTTPVDPLPPAEPPMEVPSGNPEQPAEDPLERKIRFSFSKTPWDVALTRFAELADLQLILNFKPPGTFDYQSNKAYTVPEALDILNEVLIEQKFAVLRNERFLTLAPLDQPLPLSQVPVVDEADLTHRGKNEFVTIVRRLKFASPATIEADAKKLLGPHGVLEVIPTLQMLRLTDQASKLATVLPLVDEMDDKAKPGPKPADPPPPPPKKRKTFSLKHLQPERAISVIKSILGLAGAIEPGTDDKSIIAVFSEADLAEIDTFLKEVDVPGTDELGPAEKSITLQAAQADDVAKILASLFDKESGVTIVGEPASNVVIVKAPARSIDQIVSLVQNIDERAIANAPKQETYRALGRDAKSLAEQLTETFAPRGTTNVRITADNDSQLVIVSAPPHLQEQIRATIAKLGGEANDIAEQTAVVKLEYADAEKLAATLSTVFPKTTSAATFGSEASTNSIIVRAPASSLEQIKRLAKELDLAPSLMGLREKQEEIYDLKHARGSELIKAVTTLYPTSTNVNLVATTNPKRLIISAPAPLMTKVKATLDLLDSAAQGTPETDRIYSLRNATTADILVTLKQLFPDTRFDVKFLPDEPNRRIIVFAPDEETHKRIAAAIDELDQVSPDAEVIEIYPAKSAKPSELVETLTSVFGKDATKPTFQIHRDGKSILVTANKRLQQRVADLLAKIDVPSEDPNQAASDEIYRIKYADAAELVTAFQKLYPPAESTVRISAEPKNNLLIITAPKEVHERIKTLLQNIDVPSESRMKLEIYSPGDATPSALGSVIAQMKYDGFGSVATSPDGRTLLVFATVAAQEKIKALVDRLSQQPKDEQIVRQTYRVDNVASSSIASMLSTLFPASTPNGATIVADPNGKQIVVQASPRVQEAISEVIKQSDLPTSLDETIVIAKNVPVASLYNQLSQLFSGLNGTRITYDTGTNSVGVVAPPDMKAKILAFVEKFDVPVDPASGKVRATYKLKNVPALNVYYAMITLFPATETGATFTVESRNEILIVHAPAALHENIKAEIEKLDVDPRASWVSKSIRPKNVSPQQLMTFLTAQTAAITNKTLSLGARDEEVVIHAPPVVQDEVARLVAVFDVPPPEDAQKVRQIYRPTFANAYYLSLNLQNAFPPDSGVKITYDSYSGTVTVVATAELQQKIADEVAMLDENPRKDWVEKTYLPKNVTGDQLYQMLTSALAAETNKTLTAAATGDRVVALAPKQVIERIDRLVSTLDVPAAEGGESIAKAYVIKYATPASVYTLLTQMFASTTTIKIYYDSGNTAVTVLAPSLVHERVAKVIESMDIDANAGREQKIFTPVHVPAPQLVTLLTTALAAERNTTVTLGPQRQSVVIFAPRESMARIEKYIQTLDTTQSVETTRQLYKLQFGSASYLVSTMQALYPPTLYPVVVTADSGNNLLVVEAPPLIQEKVGKLITELDVQQGGRSQAVYRLTHTRASSVLASLQNLLSGTGAVAVAGPDDLSLIVNALPTQQGQVKSFLESYDHAENKLDVESKVFNLRYATASNVWRMLQQVFANETRYRATYDDVMNTVLVSAPPDLMTKVQTLVNDTDQQSPQTKLVTEIFKLRDASANDVSRALKASFPDEKQATFVPDSSSGAVVARLSPDLVAAVRTLVEQIDKPKVGPERQVAVVDLYKVDPFEARSIVEQLFRESSEVDRPKVETTFEPPRLVVRATDTQLQQIRDVVAQLEGSKGTDSATAPNEGPRVAEKPEERIIRLNNADGAATASSIEEAWPLLRRNKLNIIYRQGPLGPARTPKERAGDDQPPPLDTPTVDPKTLPGDPDLPVSIIVGNDRLTATSRDIEALDVLQSLAEAWTEPFDPDRSASHVFYIEHADVAELVRAIDEAFNGRSERDGERRRFFRPERVRVVAEPGANALIVRASAVDLVNVRDLIESLDIPPAHDKAPRIIPLAQADAQEVVTVIKQVFSDYMTPGSGPPIAIPGVRGGNARLRTTAMSVDIDPRSNSLIISAPENIIDEVEKLVKGLEEAAADTTKNFKVIPIRNSSPADVRDALEVLLDRQLQRPSNRSTSPSRPSSTRRPKRSTTTRPSRSSSDARPILKAPIVENDAESSKTRVTTIRSPRPEQEIIKLASATDNDLDDDDLIPAHLQEDEQPEQDDPPQDPMPIADPAEPFAIGPISGIVDLTLLEDIDSLLLVGTDRDIEMLSEIVQEIEKVARGRELTFELYPLQNAKAAPLADLLNDLHARLWEARGGTSRVVSQSTIIPLAKPNALLIVAGKDEISEMLDMAKRFDVRVNPRAEFRVFRLKHVRAPLLTQTLENFYRGRAQDGELAQEVLIEPDDRSSSIIVYAAPNDMSEIAALVRELDTPQTARVNELRIFYLKHTVSPELANTLATALQTSQLTTSATANRGMPGIEVTDPSNPNKKITSGVLEGVTITPNRRANALLVSAPKETMKLIDSLITQLDVLPEAVSEIKVFSLVNSDASTMVLTLRSLFAQLQNEQNRVAVTPTVTGTDETNPLVELQFSVDERTNSILASGSREQLAVVEAVIVRLDSSDIEERRTDVYRLKNAMAQDVASALTDLLTQQQQLEGLQEGSSIQQQIEREVIVVPELLSNSLLISASPRFYEDVISIIERLDELPPQVMIQVLLVQVFLDDDSELGVELGFQDPLLYARSNQNNNISGPTAGTFLDGSTPGFNFNSGGPLGSNIFAPSPSAVGTQGLSNFALGRTNSALGYGGLVLSASSNSVSILLRALARERRLEVLSRPQIMAMDNQTATIAVGAEVPRITGSNLVQGAGVTQNIDYIPSGIILEVTPKINPDGTVIMNVTPEISRLASPNDTDQNVTIAPGVVARALEITKAITTISTQDGQTAVIGGLIRKSIEREERKVPCLGDIPYVGTLFRYDRLSRRRSELLIILTPHIVRNQADADRVKAMEAERMHWCLSDVERVHGDLGLPTEVYMETDSLHGGEINEEGTDSIEVNSGEVISYPPHEEEMEIQVTPLEPLKQDSEPSRDKDQRLPRSDEPELPIENGLQKSTSKKEPLSRRFQSPESIMSADELARQEAKKQRAEQDAKLYLPPVQNRRQEFRSWKERNLPWTRKKSTHAE